MVVNSNNYYKTEFALNDRNPETYNKTWYVRDTNSYSSNAPLTCCGLTKTDQQLTTATAMRYNNGAQSAANMVASYGVYQHTNQRQEDEDGFLPNSNNYRSAVVNSSGDTTVTRPNETTDNEETSCDWCLPPPQTSATPSNEESCWMSWCKPSILLVLLVILIVVFILVAGILIYYNCMFMWSMSVLFWHLVVYFIYEIRSQ